MIKNNDRNFFIKADHMCDVSDSKKTHVGCVITYKNRIVSYGCNSEKTHPMQKKYNQFRHDWWDCAKSSHKLHAEMAALATLDIAEFNSSSIRIYVSRKRKDGCHGMSRPCEACMAAIKDFGIKHIYYTTDDGYAYENIL